MDYMYDIIKMKGQAENLKECLNSTDITNSIKFIFEDKNEGYIPFFDGLVSKNISALQEDIDRQVSKFCISSSSPPQTGCY